MRLRKEGEELLEYEQFSEDFQSEDKLYDELRGSL